LEKYDDGTINAPHLSDAPPYDPGDTSVSTLGKVVEKYVLEDSGAYRQIIRLAVLQGSKPVLTYLRNKKESELHVRLSKVTKIKSKHTVKRRFAAK